jgi:hypothetical protein
VPLIGGGVTLGWLFMRVLASPPGVVVLAELRLFVRASAFTASRDAGMLPSGRWLGLGTPVRVSVLACPVVDGGITGVGVMTVNIHKGFTTFNRKFILPELRDAVRKVGADVVFLQEVLGTHEEHGKKIEDWPEAPHYEFLADSIWPQFAYGKNMVYPKGTTATP